MTDMPELHTRLLADVIALGSPNPLVLTGGYAVRALPQQALNAYEDQCAPANPRMPMLDDLQEIMQAAYYGPVGTPGE
ncbi:hypothetical protein ACWD26_22180 [Streptomyces sp. NPDC002787]